MAGMRCAHASVQPQIDEPVPDSEAPGEFQSALSSLWRLR